MRARGDAALIDLTDQFDKLTLTPETLRVGAKELDAAQAQCPPETLKALDVAAARIESYHRRQIPRDETYTDEIGAYPRLGAGGRSTAWGFMCRAARPAIRVRC